VGGDDGTLCILDISDLTTLKEIIFTEDESPSSALDTNLPHLTSGISTTTSVRSISWSPDGQFIAIGSSDGICTIIETISFASVERIECGKEGINSVYWGYQLPSGNMQGGKYLVIGGDDQCISIFKTSGHEALRGFNYEFGRLESFDSSSCAGDESCASSYTDVTASTASEWVFEEGSFVDIEDVALDTKDDMLTGALDANDNHFTEHISI